MFRLKRKPRIENIHEYLEVIDHIVTTRRNATSHSSNAEKLRYDRMITATQYKILGVK